MTETEYRTHPAISRSELWKISKSPLHFKYFKDHKQDETHALVFGRAAHKYILEYRTFFDEFAVAPVVDRRTKAGKEAYAEFCEKAEGKTVISAEDMMRIIDMAEAVWSHKDAYKLLSMAHDFETPFFWTDQETGEECKMRCDFMSEFNGEPVLVDYKTTDSCEDGHFERSCRRYGYKFQAGMYCEGVMQATLQDCGFVFIAQEKNPPYAVRVYSCTPEFIREGVDQFREFIGTYHFCKEKKEWYGYEGPTGSITLLTEEESYD